MRSIHVATHARWSGVGCALAGGVAGQMPEEAQGLACMGATGLAGLDELAKRGIAESYRKASRYFRSVARRAEPVRDVEREH